jgi:hypothetical protein
VHGHRKNPTGVPVDPREIGEPRGSPALPSSGESNVKFWGRRGQTPVNDAFPMGNLVGLILCGVSDERIARLHKRLQADSFGLATSTAPLWGQVPFASV